jgi:ferredoxin-NADP reductase
MSSETRLGGLAQVKRDLRMLVDELRGRRPAPFRPRTARVRPPGAAPAQVALATRRLRVASLVRETRDALTIELEDPTGAAITYLPGQFFTLLVPIDGRVVRRAYSACRPAGEGAAASRVAVTVKRIDGGLVSGHLHSRLAEGDSLEVLGPSGTFTVTPDAATERELVLLGGGSGITPLMAIARAVLAAEPGSRVALVYGNRGEADIIFRAALAELAAAHPGRFTLRHVLSEPPAGWSGGTGVLDAATCARELDALAPGPAAEYFVCGPAAMMAAARAELDRRGVAPARVHEERFASPAGPSATTTAGAVAQPVRVALRGASTDLIAAPGQTILEAGLAAGLDMPYSCTLGGCGACKVKLAEGRVVADEPGCLTPAEAEAGYVLACISRPASPCSVKVEK